METRREKPGKRLKKKRTTFKKGLKAIRKRTPEEHPKKKPVSRTELEKRALKGNNVTGTPDSGVL